MKRMMTALLALTMVFALAACGGGGAAATTPATGCVVTAELPKGWTLTDGETSIGDDGFDFIKAPDGVNNFSVLRDSQDMEHYKEMIATGNYGEDQGTVELGGATWLLTDKVAIGPIGDATCVVQNYGCDLSSAEVQGILASLQWAE